MFSDKRREEQRQHNHYRQEFREHGTRRIMLYRNNLGDSARSEYDPNKDAVVVVKIFLKIFFLPIWILYRLWQFYERNRHFKAVYKEFERRGQAKNVRGMALKWAELYPYDYPLGENSPGFSELENKFQKLMSKRNS